MKLEKLYKLTLNDDWEQHIYILPSTKDFTRMCEMFDINKTILLEELEAEPEGTTTVVLSVKRLQELDRQERKIQVGERLKDLSQLIVQEAGVESRYSEPTLDALTQVSDKFKIPEEKLMKLISELRGDIHTIIIDAAVFRSS